ncbi:MAG: hypothetical protein C4297_11470 [Gemmataceae bacterium]
MGTKKLLGSALAGYLLALLAGCTPTNPLLIGNAPIPVPVPPWVSERMEEKYTKRLKHRTPIMPPILPGSGPVYCMDPPTEEEVIRALPSVTRGIPFIYEEFRDDFTVVCEKIVDQIDPCVFVPLIGPAQLHHCHYKCTVRFKEKFLSGYPFPFQVEQERVEVVYIDKDHFHLCVGDNPATQREVAKDLSGPLGQ